MRGKMLGGELILEFIVLLVSRAWRLYPESYSESRAFLIVYYLGTRRWKLVVGAAGLLWCE